MDEVGNFVKNVLPRLIGDPAQSALNSIGVSLTDSKGNIRDVIEVYTEVGNKIKHISDVEKIAVVEGLAGKFHISRMQVLLDDLSKADSMYRSMYESSKNSGGSAFRENEVYLKSLEAKIALMRVEVEKLAVAIGDAFLTDGMFAFMNGAIGLLGTLTSLVKTFGVLPILLGTVSASIILVSRRALQLGASISTVSRTFVAGAVSSRSFSAGLNAVSAASTAGTISTGALTRAITALKMALGMGVAIAAVGFVIEKLVGVMGEARRRAEELESANREMINSYSQNKKDVDSLLSRYVELEEKMSMKDVDSGTINEYRNVQNELGQLLPSLVTGEDAYGNKLIGSSTALKVKIDLLNQQLEIEKENAKIEAEKARNEQITTGEKELGKTNEKKSDNFSILNSKLELLNKNIGNKEINISILDNNGKPLVNSLDVINEKLKEVAEKKKIAEEKGDIESLDYYKRFEMYLLQATRAEVMFGEEARKTSVELKSQYLPALEAIIDANGSMSASAKESAKALSAQLINMADPSNVTGLKNSLESLFSFDGNDDLSQKAKTVIGNITMAFNDMSNSSEEDFNKVSKSAKTMLDGLPSALESVISKEEDRIAVMEILNAAYNTAMAEHEKIIEVMKKEGLSYEEAAANVRAFANELDGVSESGEKAQRSFEDITDNIASLNKVLEDYKENNELSTQSILDLTEKYPQLLAYIHDEGLFIKELENIRNQDVALARKSLQLKMEASESFYNANIKALEVYVNEHFKFYDGDLQQFKTLAQAKADVETELINQLAKKWAIYYNTNTQSFAVDNWAIGTESANHAQEANRILNETRAAWDNFTLNRINLDFSKIGTSLDKNNKDTKNTTKTKENTKAKDDNNKVLEESIYLTDKYKKALEELDLAIARQEAIQETTPTWDSKHISALEEQLKLENEKLALQQNQSKEIESQIKKGAIQQTGIVKQTEAVKTLTKQLSGYSGTITSKFGERADKHRGTDIAGKKGTGIDAFAGGKVVAAGYAGKVGAEKMHSSYGNVVVVETDDGSKRIYAHMEKVLVKVGDQIEAGARIGTIGSTGNSTGNHLHYEKSQNGKLVDSYNEVMQARKGITITTSTVVADVQQSIDAAKSSLVSLQMDIITQKKVIREVEKELIKSAFSPIERARNVLDNEYSLNESKLANTNMLTEEYSTLLSEQTNILNNKQLANKQELDYLNALIAEGELTDVTLAELQDRTKQVTTEMNNLNQEIQGSSLRKYEVFDELRETPEKKIEALRASMELLDESSVEYGDTLNKIILLLNEIQDANKKEMLTLADDINSGEYTGEKLEELRDKYEALNVTIKDTNTQIRDTFYEASNVKFKTDDKAIDESNKKIETLKWQMGLLDDEEITLKVSLYSEISKGIQEGLADIDNAIKNAFVEREMAIAKGYSTELYDDRIQNLINSRRSQFSELQSIYSQIQSYVKSAEDAVQQAISNGKSAVESAESKAYSDASNALNNAIKESEERINKFSKAIKNLDNQLATLQESQFDAKIEITNKQLEETKNKASQIIAEYDRVASIPVYNEEQKAQVESQLQSLKDELASANVQIIEYVKNLELTHFESLTYGANKASKEIDRLTGKLNKNLELLEGGLLAGTDLDFSIDSVSGKTLDLSTLISNPLAERDAQIQIQDIRSSAYGAQIAEAESQAQREIALAQEKYEDLKKQAEEFQKVMADDQLKFEEDLKKLMDASAKDKEKIKKKEGDALNKTADESAKTELDNLKRHYENIILLMSSSGMDMKNQYSSIWGDIIRDLESNVAQAEAVIGGLNTSTNISKDKTTSALPALNGVAGIMQGIISGNGIMNFITKLPTYAGGTEGASGGLSLLGEEGQELVVQKDGQAYLTSPSHELRHLNKGDQVFTADETKSMLSKNKSPISAYANGTGENISFLNMISEIMKLKPTENLSNQFSNPNWQQNTIDWQKYTDSVNEALQVALKALTNGNNELISTFKEKFPDFKAVADRLEYDTLKKQYTETMLTKVIKDVELAYMEFSDSYSDKEGNVYNKQDGKYVNGSRNEIYDPENKTLTILLSNSSVDETTKEPNTKDTESVNLILNSLFKNQEHLIDLVDKSTFDVNKGSIINESSNSSANDMNKYRDHVQNLSEIALQSLITGSDELVKKFKQDYANADNIINKFDINTLKNIFSSREKDYNYKDVENGNNTLVKDIIDSLYKEEQGRKVVFDGYVQQVETYKNSEEDAYHYAHYMNELQKYSIGAVKDGSVELLNLFREKFPDYNSLINNVTNETFLKYFDKNPNIHVENLMHDYALDGYLKKVTFDLLTEVVNGTVSEFTDYKTVLSERFEQLSKSFFFEDNLTDLFGNSIRDKSVDDILANAQKSNSEAIGKLEPPNMANYVLVYKNGVPFGWYPPDAVDSIANSNTGHFTTGKEQASLYMKNNSSGGSGGSGGSGSLDYIFGSSSSKAPITYSKEFIEKYDPYGEKGVPVFEQSRNERTKEIEALQKLLDAELALETVNDSKVQQLTKTILEKQQAKNTADSLYVVESLNDLSQQRQKIAQELKDTLTNELKKALANGSITEDGANRVREEIANQNEIINNALLEQKNLVKQKLELEQAARDNVLQSIVNEQESLNKSLDIAEKFESGNFDKSIYLLTQITDKANEYNEVIQSQKKSLEEQLKLLPVGSFEWNSLNSLVQDYNNRLQDSNTNLLEMSTRLGELKATKLSKGIEDSIKFMQDGIEALGTIDTQFERNKAIKYVKNIGSELEKQLSSINGRINEINIELSTETSESKIRQLKAELNSLTETRHTIRVNVISNIESLIQKVRDFDVSKFSDIKDVTGGDWMSMKPTTLAGQEKFNELLEERNSQLTQGNNEYEEFLKKVEEARFNAMLEGADDSLKQFSKYIGVIDQQLAVLEDGKSALNPDIDYDSAPIVKPLTSDQAENKVERPSSDGGFTAPPTIVDEIYADFKSELASTMKVINETQAKIDGLGKITPENKQQFIDYITSMKSQVSGLENFVKSKRDSLKVQLELGKISKEDFDYQMEIIDNAELEILAIPKVQIAEDAREQLILAGKELANSMMTDLNKVIKENRLEISLLGEIDTAEEEAKVKEALGNILAAYESEREKIIARIKEIKEALSAEITEEENIILTAELESLTVNLESINAGITTVKNEFEGAAPVDVKVDADTTIAKEKIDELNKEQIKITVHADTTMASNAINSLNRNITVTITENRVAGTTTAPIDGYANGTVGTKSSGKALVSEFGKELIIEPDGTAYFSGEKPEIRNLPKGTQVVPADQSKNLFTNKKDIIPAFAEGTKYKKVLLLKDVFNGKGERVSAGETVVFENEVDGFLKQGYRYPRHNEPVVSSKEVNEYNNSMFGSTTTKQDNSNLSKEEIKKLTGNAIYQLVRYSNSKQVKEFKDKYSDVDSIINDMSLDELYNKYVGTYNQFDKDIAKGLYTVDNYNNSNTNDSSSNGNSSNANSNDKFELSKATTDSVNEVLNNILIKYLDPKNGLTLNDIANIDNKDVLLGFKKDLQLGIVDGAKIINKELTDVFNSLEKDAEGNFVDMDKAKQIADRITSNIALMEQAQVAIKSITKEQFDYNQSLREKAIKVYTDTIDDLEHEMNLTDEDDYGKRIKLNEKIAATLSNQLKSLQSQKAELVKLLSTQEKGSYEWNLTNDAIDNIQESIEDVSVSLNNTNKEIKDNADGIIETMKRAIEKQRDLTIASFRKQLESLEKLYNDKMDAIGDRETERTYAKDLLEKEKEIAEIEKQLNILALDNSQSAIAKRLDLEEMLADKKEDLEEFKYQKSVELEKKAIEDTHKNHKESIEQQIEDEEYKFNEILANERYWATVREEIINGNLDSVNAKYIELLNMFNSYNDATIKGMEMSFQELKNLIDEVGKSYDSINNKTQINIPIPTPSVPNKPAAGLPPTTPTHKPDPPYSNDTDTAYYDNSKKVYVRGNKQYTQDEFDSAFINNYFRTANELFNYLDSIGKGTIIKKYKNGGLTSNTGLHWLDGTKADPEIVLNSSDTKNLLSAIQINKDFLSMLPKINLPTLPNFSKPDFSAIKNYNLTLNIDNLNGTQKDADNLATTIMTNLKKWGR